MTESRSTGNCSVVVYWYDSRGQEPFPMNLSSIFLHACVFTSEVCVCVDTVIFIQGAQECLRHFTQLSQSPGREEAARFVSEIEFCVGMVEQLLREPNSLIINMPRIKECRLPKGRALKDNTDLQIFCDYFL